MMVAQIVSDLLGLIVALKPEAYGENKCTSTMGKY